MKESFAKDFTFLKNSKEAYQELENWLQKKDSKVLMFGTKHRDSSSAYFMSSDFFKNLKKLNCIVAIELDHDHINPKNGKTSEEEFRKFNESQGRENIPLILFQMSQFPMIHRLYDAHKEGLEIYPVDSGDTVTKSQKWNSKSLKYEPEITRDEIMSKKILELLKENPGKKIVLLEEPLIVWEEKLVQLLSMLICHLMMNPSLRFKIRRSFRKQCCIKCFGSGRGCSS